MTSDEWLEKSPLSFTDEQHSGSYSDTYKREQGKQQPISEHSALMNSFLWSNLVFSSNAVLSNSGLPKNLIQPLPKAVLSGKESSNNFCCICSRYIYKKQKKSIDQI